MNIICLISLIPQCTCSISLNTPIKTEMCIFLFCVMHFGIWDRHIMGFVNQTSSWDIPKLPCQDWSLHWRHNDHDGVSNHQPHGCLLNRWFRRGSKKTSKLRVTGLCAGNSPGTGEFPAHMTSNAENVSIWWRHHVQLLSHGREKLIVEWIYPLECIRTTLRIYDIILK